MSNGSQAKQIGKLALDIEPEVLREIISSGRLAEFAATAAAQAAQEISSQIVDQVASAALDPDKIKAGAKVGFGYVFEGGDFGTVGPRGPRPIPKPKGGVLVVQTLTQRTV